MKRYNKSKRILKKKQYPELRRKKIRCPICGKYKKCFINEYRTAIVCRTNNVLRSVEVTSSATKRRKYSPFVTL